MSLFLTISEKVKNNRTILCGLLLGCVAWLMIWGTYDTDITRIFAPGFPHNVLDLIHGLRSLLPFLAISVSGIFLLKKRHWPRNFFLTPLGLLSLYVIVGICSSVFSENPLQALYWTVLYGSPIVVLVAMLASQEPLKKLALIININWVIAGVIALGLVVFFLMQPGVIPSLNPKFLICGARPYESLGNVSFEINTFGVAGTRPTGLARYAGAAAIACFFIFCFSRKNKKYIWLMLFSVFTAILIFARGRTEVVGFLVAIPAVLLLARKYKYFFIFLTALIIFLVSFGFFYTSTCAFPAVIMPKIVQPTAPPITPPMTPPIITQTTKPKQTKANPIVFLTKDSNLLTLSGRVNGVWQDSWRLFLANPLMGFGFQADRFSLNGQHAHNSILHALIQTGILGTIPFALAFVVTFLMLWRLLFRTDIALKHRHFLIGTFAVLLFFAVRGITESVAFFSADWLFVAPVIAYIQCLDSQTKSGRVLKTPVMDFCGLKVTVTNTKDMVATMASWIRAEKKEPHWVVVADMHGVTQTYKQADFKDIISGADVLVPDGISLVWLARLKGFDIQKRVSGSDIMREFFRVASQTGFSNYFYGDTGETLKALQKKLMEDFPNLKIAGVYSPPFRELTRQEDEEMVKKINQANPDVLWVALGVPKQEAWIFQHRAELNVALMVGVGAAFKFLSGRVQRAPAWIGDLGFEWLWRLVFETKTTWRRVLFDGPIFVWMAFTDLISGPTGK